jgi:hypothetical protein
MSTRKLIRANLEFLADLKTVTLDEVVVSPRGFNN